MYISVSLMYETFLAKPETDKPMVLCTVWHRMRLDIW